MHSSFHVPRKWKNYIPDKKRMRAPVGKHFCPSLKLIQAIQDATDIKAVFQKKTFYLIFEILVRRMLEGQATGIKDFGTFSVRKYHRPPTKTLKRSKHYLEIPIYIPIFLVSKDIKKASTFSVNHPQQSEMICEAFKKSEPKKQIMLPEQIMEEILERSGVRPIHVMLSTHLLFEAIITASFKNRLFVVPGFGLFNNCKRPSRKQGNPELGEEITISPELIIPRFLPEQQLIDSVTKAMRLRNGDPEEKKQTREKKLSTIFVDNCPAETVI